MDIYNELHERHNLLCVASVNLPQFNELVDKYQKFWDEGSRFCWEGVSAMDIFNPDMQKRNPADDEKELNACIEELAAKIKTALLEKWVEQYDHKQMQFILNGLTGLDWYGKLVIGGMDVQYHEIVSAWNKVHPDAEYQVYLDSGFEI